MYMNASYRATNPEMVSGAYGDVNGDGMVDYVYLTAVKSESSPYLENIRLNIQDGVTHQIFTIELKENSGYHPTIFLGDFTGNGVKDILITIDSGGSGALTFNYVYSFVKNKAQKLFDFEDYNERNQYTVTYKDNYKVRVKSQATRQAFLIDISDRDVNYLSDIYHENGKLKKPIQGMYDGVSGFYPVDMDRDGVYEIQAYQKISGLYHADGLGYIINSLKWDKDTFSIWQQWLAIYGSNPH